VLKILDIFVLNSTILGNDFMRFANI